MDELMSSSEWEDEWVNLDRDQLVEFLRSSSLRVKVGLEKRTLEFSVPESFGWG
jgi:hypothetical protein